TGALGVVASIASRAGAARPAIAAGAAIHSVLADDEPAGSSDRGATDEDGTGGRAGGACAAIAPVAARVARRAVARQVGHAAARECLDDGVRVDPDAPSVDLQVAPPQNVCAAVEHQHVVGGVELDPDALLIAEAEDLVERDRRLGERRLR